MTALTAKIIAMSLLGFAVGPPIIIIPIINLTTVLCAALILKNADNKKTV